MIRKTSPRFQEKYLQQEIREFTKNYEYELTFTTNDDISTSINLLDENITDEIFNPDFIFSDEYLLMVLNHAYDYITKLQKVTYKLFKRERERETYNIENTNSFLSRHLQCQLKLLFLDRKLKELGQESRIIETLKANSSKAPKNNLLIGGKKPNISERYKIVNDLFNIYNTINKKNISATTKHILLAHVLGCSEQTARELFNGTQQKRTPIREDIIDPYLDNLK